ncbi:MAG: LamG domain-containing protein [Candidatus Woesearchaeota archaeon]
MVKRGLVIISLVLVLTFSFVAAKFSYFDATPEIQYSPNPDGLISHYKLDGDARDYAGSYNGILMNGVNCDVEGKIGQACEFDGVNDYVNIGSYSIYNVDVGEAQSFSTWIKAKKQTGRNGFFLWKQGGCLGWDIRLESDGDIYFSIKTGTGCKASGKNSTGYGVLAKDKDYDDDQWHHVVGVIDRPNNEMSLYIDGEFKGLKWIDNVDGAAGGRFMLGTVWNYNPNNTYSGKIDDVRVYDKALSESEILELYQEATYDSCDTNQDGIVSNAEYATCYNITVQCIDSDGGINYAVKGKVSGNIGSGYPNSYQEYGDSCLNSSDLVERYCSEDYTNFTTSYVCPNGCQDGACLKESNQTTACIDSDGGLDYYVKGSARYSWQDESEGMRDECISVPGYPENYTEVENCEGSKCFLNEVECIEGNPTAYNYACPNGCQDGACIQKTSSTCSALINKLANPTDFEDGNIKYLLMYNNVWYGDWWMEDGKLYNFTEYYASWRTSYEYNENVWKNGYIHYSIMVFDDPNFDTSDMMDDLISHRVCQVQSYWNYNSQEYKVYICSWDHNNQGIDLDYDYKSREILWPNGNVFVRMDLGVGRWMSDDEVNQLIVERTGEFINSLIDNREDYQGWDSFDIEWPLSNQVFSTLSDCPSTIPKDVCSPCWNCKTEPVVCPPHGRQQEICVDYCCDNSDIKISKGCSPGICAGCLIDGDYLGDNTCVPYGTRMNEFKRYIYLNEGDIEKIEFAQGQTYEISIMYITNSEVVLNINGMMTDHLQQRTTYKLPDGTKIEILYFFSRSYDGGEEGRGVAVNFLRDEPSYCNYDGRVLRQKSPDYKGDWARCQNSYECESNICSSGECIELQNMLNQAGRMKSLGVRVLCRLAHIFSEDNYNDCVYRFLGSELTTTPSSGGGGGGGVSSSSSSGGG